MLRARHALLLGPLVATLACGSPPPAASPPTRAPAPVASSTPPPAPAPDAAATTRALADRAQALYFEESPEFVTYLGITSAKHDRLPDHSPAALRRYEAMEDALLADVKAVDAAALAGKPEETLLAVMREWLEGMIGTRVCKYELWGVNQFMGWQAFDAVVASAQPMGTPERRAQAIARWRSLPKFIDQEIANLREGLAEGYSSPKHNVSLVVAQLDKLIAAEPQNTPFFAPAANDGSPDVKATFTSIVKDDIQPALKRFRDFLSSEYLPKARDAIGLPALPHGRECYQASLRRLSSRQVSPAEVHATGLAQVAALREEASAVAKRSLGTADLTQAFAKLTAPPYTFHTRDEVVEVSRAAIERARAALPRAFGILPKADVEIKQAEPYRERNMVAMYVPAADDGSRPGRFVIVTYDPEKRSRAGVESTAFHEAIPGHHLQITIAAEQSARAAHPFQRLVFNPGYGEGWALYAERLADELGLFTSDIDRLGMLSQQLMRASRLVVDSGIHDLGWTREQCMQYLRENTVMPPGEIESEVDRYVVWPGQASSYMLGMLEIRSIRNDAEKALGPAFDLRAFHDRVLEDGPMPLAALRRKIERWVAAKKP